MRKEGFGFGKVSNERQTAFPDAAAAENAFSSAHRITIAAAIETDAANTRRKPRKLERGRGARVSTSLTEEEGGQKRGSIGRGRKEGPENFLTCTFRQLFFRARL